MPEQIRIILANLRSFGPRRLAMMAGVTALVFAVIGLGAYFLNKPAFETLYVNLDRADVNQIGLVLGDAGIGFDVAADGTTVLVAAGTTAQARMLLAEKGLPTSTNAGWTVGGGVEFALPGNWTAKAEYLHVDLGHNNCGANCGVAPTDNVSMHEDVVRAGLNYHFGWGK